MGCCPLTAQPLDTDQAAKLAPMFKALGDPVRLRLLSLIAAADARSRGAAEVSTNGGAGADGAVCVCELTGSFDLSAPTISHHLKVLRRAGLVESRRQGTWVYYRLRPEALAALGALLA